MLNAKREKQRQDRNAVGAISFDDGAVVKVAGEGKATGKQHRLASLGRHRGAEGTLCGLPGDTSGVQIPDGVGGS